VVDEHDLGERLRSVRNRLRGMNVSLEELKPRGLGIYLIRQMMDEVHYEPTQDRGNTLTMIKHHTR
jgi:anti-sigma regulatory factor (Ser/Thr protein kinase)